MLLLLSTVVVLVTVVSGDKYTVTEEAWFEVEVKDFEGPGLDYRGTFTIALFGETAPMTVLNFVSLTRGYTKLGKVCLLLNIRLIY